MLQGGWHGLRQPEGQEGDGLDGQDGGKAAAHESYHRGVRVEPNDYSAKDAIAFGKIMPDNDAFLAVSGSSVMDTAKTVHT